MEMQVLRRIGTADITRGLKIPALDKDGKPEMKDGKSVLKGWKGTDYGPVYIIIGKAKGTHSDQTQFGTYHEFIGSFEATIIATGDTRVAPKTILPPPTDEVFLNNYLAAKAANANAEVPMAFVIGTEEHKHAGETKFRWTCTPLDIGENIVADPLAEIKEAIASQITAMLPAPPKQLAAPKAEAKEVKPAA